MWEGENERKSVHSRPEAWELAALLYFSTAVQAMYTIFPQLVTQVYETKPLGMQTATTSERMVTLRSSAE